MKSQLGMHRRAGLRWLLERLLPDHARETIAGDLREEFIEAILPRQRLVWRAHSGTSGKW